MSKLARAFGEAQEQTLAPKRFALQQRAQEQQARQNRFANMLAQRQQGQREAQQRFTQEQALRAPQLAEQEAIGDFERKKALLEFQQGLTPQVPSFEEKLRMQTAADIDLAEAKFGIKQRELAAEERPLSLQEQLSQAETIGLKPTKLKGGEISFEAAEDPTQKVSFIKQKNKDTSDLIDTVMSGDFKKENINKVLADAQDIPQGLLGKVEIDMLKRFSPDSPVLAKWQNLKSVLTDAQLMKTARTKGAISDREMELFAEAVANDDINSMPRITATLSRMMNQLEQEANVARSTFGQLYGEQELQAVLSNLTQGVPEAQPSANTQIWTDANGNIAEVEVDEQGNAIRVIREL